MSTKNKIIELTTWETEFLTGSLRSIIYNNMPLPKPTPKGETLKVSLTWVLSIGAVKSLEILLSKLSEKNIQLKLPL